MARVDLNKLRDTILETQSKNESLPTATCDKIFVNQKGEIIQGSPQLAGEDQRRLSEVHQGTFAQ